jgi:hypothetical protein
MPHFVVLERVKPILAAVVLFAATVAGSGCAKSKSKDTGSSSSTAAGPAYVDVDVEGAECAACRDKSTAKFCEPSYITPVASEHIKVNGRKGCGGFEDPKLRASCENIIRCIRSQKCAEGESPNGCLCGNLDLATCAATKYWPGLCVSTYEAAMAGALPKTLIRQFGDPRSPIGVANSTFICDVVSKCPCDTKK